MLNIVNAHNIRRNDRRHPKGASMRRNSLIVANQGLGTDQRDRSNNCIVEYYSVRADQRIIVNSAPFEVHAMSDNASIADDGVKCACAMNNCSILN